MTGIRKRLLASFRGPVVWKGTAEEYKALIAWKEKCLAATEEELRTLAGSNIWLEQTIEELKKHLRDLHQWLGELNGDT